MEEMVKGTRKLSGVAGSEREGGKDKECDVSKVGRVEQKCLQLRVCEPTFHTTIICSLYVFPKIQH